MGIDAGILAIIGATAAVGGAAIQYQGLRRADKASQEQQRVEQRIQEVNDLRARRQRAARARVVLAEQEAGAQVAGAATSSAAAGGASSGVSDVAAANAASTTSLLAGRELTRIRGNVLSGRRQAQQGQLIGGLGGKLYKGFGGASSIRAFVS